MILVDTSVWISHFRQADRQLQKWLDAQEVLAHPFVQGELACGDLGQRQQRDEVLGLFDRLPHAAVLDHALVLSFVEAAKLAGNGLGWVDLHLLASCSGMPCDVATQDKQFAKAARAFGIRVR